MTVHLVLGGARSGKSKFAEQRVLEQSAKVGSRRHYIATATVLDDEMQNRIEHHKKRRDNAWIEHECPLHISALLTQFDSRDVILVDCLTLWLNNLLFDLGDEATQEQIESGVQALVDALSSTSAHIVLVSNEVGLGVVPLGKVTRLFVDNAGWMNQAIAQIAQRVTLVTAGLPMELKND
ncbi:bifunctional adenosylcobinamide kinase/adenosylcobinamide-phosphate guanylyltransferase [Vibrio sonorensis]|uniref:bifunctional adenosylcobinamide kinase/adenosylcobinamide-phosphate guanylyltransferase n=1 Tax=Vibrio sonorensis TaxID=1004316 RepID=UPI0008DACAF7|nr:bifunctional adenosylcobinamide kinase/adenosylcobinamide-phosphate guanylyltransferase [Vibrio sonorensis]